MSQNKILGISNNTNIGGNDFQLSKFTAKCEQAKIEYVYLGATGGWKTTIPGGAKVLTGSFEMAADNTMLSLTEAGYLSPFSDTYVTFSIPVGSKTLGFSAVVQDVEVDINPDLVTIKGNYQSSGVVSFA